MEIVCNCAENAVQNGDLSYFLRFVLDRKIKERKNAGEEKNETMKIFFFLSNFKSNFV